MAGNVGNLQWLVYFAVFAVGVGVGVGVAFLVKLRDPRTKELEEQLAEARDELSAYRGQVDEHFARTSNLLQEMTASYRTVYEHLASGAQNLCAGSATTPRLELPGMAALGVGETASPSGEAQHPHVRMAQPPEEPEGKREASVSPSAPHPDVTGPEQPAPDEAERADAGASGRPGQ